MIRTTIDRPAGLIFDNGRTVVRLRRLAAGERIDGEPEAVLAFAAGGVRIAVERGPPVDAGAGETIHLPSHQAWSATAADTGATFIEVVSRHPALDLARRNMPPLDDIDMFALGADRRFRYTDYFRGGVIVFRGEDHAPKHFHKDADEVFWFLEGQCRLATPAGETICGPGDITVFPAEVWHSLHNIDPEKPLRLFFTVTPNIVPSHTHFHPDGSPWIKSMLPLTGA